MKVGQNKPLFVLKMIHVFNALLTKSLYIIVNHKLIWRLEIV